MLVRPAYDRLALDEGQRRLLARTMTGLRRLLLGCGGRLGTLLGGIAKETLIAHGQLLLKLAQAQPQLLVTLALEGCDLAHQLRDHVDQPLVLSLQQERGLPQCLDVLLSLQAHADEARDAYRMAHQIG